MSESEPPPDRLNPERVARARHDQYTADIEVTPAVEDKDSIEHASQAHILKVMELMGCDEGYESSVRRLPHIDIRREVQCASEIDTAGLNRVANVFRTK